MEVLIFLSVWLGVAAAAAIVAGNKGRSRLGWGLFGLCLPLIALLIVGVLPSRQADRRSRRPCPACGEMILEIATVCPHCRSAVTPVAEPQINDAPAKSHLHAVPAAREEQTPQRRAAG